MHRLLSTQSCAVPSQPVTLGKTAPPWASDSHLLPVNPEGGSLGRGVCSQICKGALCRDACGLSPVRSPLPALQTHPVRDPGAGAAGSATGPRVGHTPLQPPQDSWRVSHRPRRWRGAKPPETPAQAGSLSAGLGTSPLPHLHFAPRNSSPDVAFQSTRGLRTLILRPEDDLTPVAGASCRPTQLVPQERPRLCRVHGRSCTGGGAQVVLTLIAFSYVSPDHCSGNGLFLSSEKGQARCGLLLAPSPAEADRDPCTFPAAWSRLPVAQGSSRWPWSQGPAPVGG